MDKKLTLSLDAKVIARAKDYAQNHGTSLSRMVENYLFLLTTEKETNSEERKYSTVVNSLVGSLNLAEDFDYKSDYTDYLIEKYK